MTFADWLRKSGHKIRERGAKEGIRLSGYELWEGMVRRTAPLWPAGEPVWDREWDVLVIVDACRHDLMQSVADEYDWLPDRVDSIWSVGSKTPEWMEKTFREEYASELERTAYVTGNPHSDDHPIERFAHSDELWRTHWEEGEISTMPPEPLTERAIDVWRRREELGVERMIVHYIQPHYPFYDHPEFGDGYMQTFGRGGAPRPDKNVWLRLRDGEVDPKDVWAGYQHNLSVALEEIDRFRRSCDGSVVVSSDHGNGMGEWGVWAHPRGVPTGSLRKVPWLPIESVDTGEYEPQLELPATEDRDQDARDRLSALGYVE